MTHRFRYIAAAAGLAFISAAGCGERAGHHLTASEAPALSTTYGAVLLECPASETQSARAVIGPAGGTVQVAGHRLTVPLGAVRGLQEFEVRVPASNHLEVQIRATGKQSYQFHARATVTLSYDRCTRNNIRKEDLRVYYIDRETKEILHDMGGVNDTQARTLTTSTDHLSGYAVGVNRSGE